MSEKNIIEATYQDRMTVWRETVEQNERVTRAVYSNVRCALSRSAHTASPSPPTGRTPLGETEYRLSLFTPAGVCLMAGDRVEVRRAWETVHGIASHSFTYPTHAVCVLIVREVTV